MRLTPSAYAYDGLPHRIVRPITNSADLDHTYHDDYDGQPGVVVETRNGSDQVLKQHVWGVTYVDELVQVAINGDPCEDPLFNPEDPDHDGRYYYAVHNANYNVQLLIDDTAVVVERYEYAPYGERTVYISPGSNDPDCHAPTMLPQRVKVGGIDQPYAINAMGFQGRPHCDISDLIDHRNRQWTTRLGRWGQRDPLGYPDGLNAYAGYHVLHGGRDPYGTDNLADCMQKCDNFAEAYRQKRRDKDIDGAIRLYLLNCYKCCAQRRNEDCWKRVDLRPYDPSGSKKPSKKSFCDDTSSSETGYPIGVDDVQL